MNNLAGVYQICNLVNGMRYFGQTKNLQIRWKEHRKKLNANTHFNSHLQSAWNKYGENSFIFEPLMCCDISDLNWFEQILLDVAKNNKPLFYNKSYLAEGNGQRGLKRSKETREKIRQNNLNRPKETNAKIGVANRNRKRSETFKRRLSDNHPNVRAIKKIDLQTKEVVCTYRSIVDAATDNNISESVIRRVASKKYKNRTAGGFLYEYAD